MGALVPLLIISLISVVHGDFECNDLGKFGNQDDETCQSYFECIKLNGTINIISLNCSNGQKFDPTIFKCSKDFICSEHNTIKRRSRSLLFFESEFVCSQPGRFPDKTDAYRTRYFLCHQHLDGSFTRIRYECSRDVQIFEENLQKCVTKNNDMLNCEGKGRFKIENDDTDKLYYLCYDNGEKLIAVRYMCPEDKYFDENTSNCERIFFAPTEKPDDNSNILEMCKTKDRFMDPADPTHTKYYVCTKLNYGNRVVTTQYTCPENSTFNEEISSCTVKVEIPSISMTERPSHNYGTSSTIPTCPCNGTATTGKEYVCTDYGLFPDKFSPFCEHYYECQVSRFSIEKLHHRCPVGTAFDPIYLLCSSKYACHASASDSSDFVCKIRGYFVNPKSKYSYYMCDVASDGTIYGTIHNCPKMYFFDATNEICTPDP